MSEYVLDAQGIGISFGGLKAVQDFSLRIPRGGLHGLIGPNGAGKTTAFNLLTGVYRTQTGSIALGGKRIDGLRPYQIASSGLCRTFQNIRLFGELSVLDNVKLAEHVRVKHTIAASILRTGREIADERAMTERAKGLLRVFELEKFEEEQARNLCYGDQRRLEIARAMATRPIVLLLDEPAAGMNPQEKKELAKSIRRIRDEFALTILLIEHDMGLVMDICEHLTVLDHGVTIAAGEPRKVQNNPKVIEAYLGVAEEGAGHEAEKTQSSKAQSNK